jgi:O-acetylhomoserine/O-acetylserine sulfhydrylase-like pyridoxal-dependent enzyme
MKQHCENAIAIAQFLEEHEKVDSVFFPGLKKNFSQKP